MTTKTNDKDIRTNGVMLAMVPDEKVAKTLAIPGGDPPSQLHLTLAYLGTEDDLTEAEKNCLKNLVKRLGTLLNRFELKGSISGLGYFENPDNTQECLYASVDVPGLSSVYHWVLSECRRKGLPMHGEHDFQPHITLKYQPVGTPRPRRKTPLPELEFKCSNLICKIGSKTYSWEKPGDIECPECGYEDCQCITLKDNGHNTFSKYFQQKAV